MQCALLHINHKTTQLHLGLVVVVVPTYIPNHGRQKTKQNSSMCLKFTVFRHTGGGGRNHHPTQLNICVKDGGYRCLNTC